MKVAVSAVWAVTVCAGIVMAGFPAEIRAENVPPKAESRAATATKTPAANGAKGDGANAQAPSKAVQQPAQRPSPRPGLLQLAEDGDKEAQFRLGEAFFTGKGQVRDPLAAVSWWVIAAGNGSVEAALRLGEIHSRGTALPRDNAKAALWYYRAGVMGSQEGRDKFVGMIINDQAHDVMGLEGLKWLEEAASTDRVSQLKFIEVLWHGLGVPKDYNRARDLLLKGALAGDAEFQTRLGEVMIKEPALYRVIYKDPHQEANNTRRWRVYSNLSEAQERMEGDQIIDLVRPNMVRGEIWLRRAASQNHIGAHRVLAKAYLEGVDLPANPKLAVRHLQSAALLGDKEAHVVLARLAASGQGFPNADPVRAYVGFELAGETALRDELVKSMSRGQVNRAKAASALF